MCLHTERFLCCAKESNSSFLCIEPHLPHVLIEDGDMTPEEYDEHLKGRSDYIKATKKDCSNEKTVSGRKRVKEYVRLRVVENSLSVLQGRKLAKQA